MTNLKVRLIIFVVAYTVGWLSCLAYRVWQTGREVERICQKIERDD